MNKFFYALLMFCASLGLRAQTPADTEAIRQALTSIQQRVSTVATLNDASSRPANWRELMAADMDSVIAAANSIKTTAQSSASSGTSRTVSVPAGGNLQTALNDVVPGDTIVLQAGAVYTGSFMLPAKSGTGYITITSSAISGLPAGQRVTPAMASLMPRIASPGGTAFKTMPGAHHYRLSGLEITGASGSFAATNIVQIGAGDETSAAALPTDIELDRVWVHGDAVAGAKRGVSMNGIRLKISNSYISNIFSTYQETQAVCAWNTPGPLEVGNTFMEAAGMSVLIGGAEPSIVGVTPSDILLVGNHFSKPAAWKQKNFVMKHLLELKTGRRVTIRGNLFEQNWINSAINIKPGTENVRTPAVTSDVSIVDNVIRRSQSGIILLGRNTTGGRVSNVTVRNNLFSEMTAEWGGAWSVFTILDGVAGLTIENNTAAPAQVNTFIVADLTPTTGLIFRNNIMPRGTYGMFGSSAGEGLRSMIYFPAGIVSNNVIYGSPANLASIYPAGNYFPSTVEEVGWMNVQSGEYQLTPTSTYLTAGANAQRPGVNWSTVKSLTLIP